MANQGGLCFIMKNQIRIRVERSESSIILYWDSQNLGLYVTNLESIFKNLDIVFFVAQKANEFLRERSNDYEKAKGILAPYIFQEKISPKEEIP